MEAKLVKSAIYGFIFGVAISILLVPDKITLHRGDLVTITDVNKWDYIISILRHSITVSLIVTIAVAIWELRKKTIKQTTAGI